MKKYQVKITDTQKKFVEVEANSEVEATAIAQEKYQNGDYAYKGVAINTLTFEAKRAILWEPVLESENEKGGYSIYTILYDGTRYWITENPDGSFRIEEQLGDRFVLAHKDGSNLLSLLDAKDFFRDYIADRSEPEPLLPESCYGVLQSTGQVIIIKRGESGYLLTDIQAANKREAQEIADEYNSMRGITKAQAVAMSAGSMFGWDIPAANPGNYDDNGVLKKDTGTYIEISSECDDEEIEPEM